MECCQQAAPKWAKVKPALLSWIFQTIFTTELNIDETTLEVLYVVNSNALEKEVKFSVGSRQLW